jgi:hypothetical protein
MFNHKIITKVGWFDKNSFSKNSFSKTPERRNHATETTESQITPSTAQGA